MGGPSIDGNVRIAEEAANAVALWHNPHSRPHGNGHAGDGGPRRAGARPSLRITP